MLQINEECRQSNFSSVDATQLYANGNQGKGTHSLLAFLYRWWYPKTDCGFTQNADSNWVMNVSMTECDISVAHLNASTIEYKLDLSTLNENDSNGS